MFSKPSEFLKELDSHGIYDAAMLSKCDFATDAIPTYSPEQTARAIENRGLGGELVEKPASKLIYGWTAAAALARSILGDAPGSAFMGRGSSFRADLKALEEAGH